MQSPNHRPGKLETLTHMQLRPITGQENQAHNTSICSTDKLSQHALQNMYCMKEAAEAQSCIQVDTAK